MNKKRSKQKSTKKEKLKARLKKAKGLKIAKNKPIPNDLEPISDKAQDLEKKTDKINIIPAENKKIEPTHISNAEIKDKIIDTKKSAKTYVISRNDILELVPKNITQKRLQPFVLNKEQKQKIVEDINKTDFETIILYLKQARSIIKMWQSSIEYNTNQKISKKTSLTANQIDKTLTEYILATKEFKNSILKTINNKHTKWRKLIKAHDHINQTNIIMHSQTIENINDILSEIQQTKPNVKNIILFNLDKKLKLKLFNENKPEYIWLEFWSKYDFSNEFNRQVSILNNTINNLEKSRYTGDDEWKIIKQISEGYYTTQEIEEIALGIVGETMVINIIESINEDYTNFDNDQKDMMLLLIKYLIKSDRPYQNLLTKDAIENFISILNKLDDNTKIKSQKEIIQQASNTFKQKLTKRKENYSNFLTKIKDGELSSDHLERRINRLTQQTKNNHIQPISFVAQIYDILTIANASYFKQNINSTFINSLKAAINFVPGATQSYLSTIKVTRIYEKDNLAKINISLPEKINLPKNFQQQNYIINNLELIAKGINKEHDSFAAWLCTEIENYFKCSFIECKMTEFRFAPWKTDLENATCNIKTEQISPTLSHLIQFGNTFSIFVANSIITKYNEGKRLTRSNISQMENILKFYQRLMIFAINNGASHTFYYCNQGIENSVIKKLELNGDKQLQHKLNNIESKVTNLKSLALVNPMPHIPFLLESIEDKYNNDYKVDQILLGGKALNTIRQQQNLLKKEHLTADSKIYETIANLTLDNSIVDFISTTDEPQINLIKANKKLDEKLKYFFIPTTKLENYSIMDICKITNECVIENHPLPFRISPDSNEHIEGKNAVINYLRDKIETENTLPNLAHVINIMNNMEKILYKDKIEYIGFYNDRVKILSAYSDRLHYLNTPPVPKEKINQIKLFFEDYKEVSNLILAKDDKQNISEALSGDKTTVKELVRYFEQLKSNIGTSENIQSPHESAEVYLKNLAAILSNEQGKDLVLPGGMPETDIEKEEIGTGLVIDIEYETHPSYIGYAESINTFTEVGERIEPKNPPFSNARIIELFTSSFPWAITKESQLQNTQNIDNLLNTDITIDPLLQKSILDLVFCSLDILGKLAGKNGDFALNNLEEIDQIIDTLNDIADTIKSKEVFSDVDQLKGIQESINLKLSIVEKNNDILYKKLINKVQLEPNEKISANVELNSFLHLNEQIAHQYLRDIFASSDLDNIFKTYITPPVHG